MNLKLLHESIAMLAQHRKPDEQLPDYIASLTRKLGIVKNLIQDRQFTDLTKNRKKPVLQFLYACCFLLKKLAKLIAEDTSDTTACLISVQQQQNIKILLQLIFSLGVNYCLVKGVNVPLLMKTLQLKLMHNEDWSPLQKHVVFKSITRDIANLAKSAPLRPLILGHLGDLLSALLQLMYCKIKEPQQRLVTSADGSSFYVTEEWYAKLLKERDEFVVVHDELVNGLYKPLIIKELMILLMPNRPKNLPIPRWLDKAIASSLNAYLTGPGGVALVMRACLPSESEDIDWKKVDSLTKLITNFPGDIDIDVFYSSISSQIVSLFSTTGSYCLPVAKTSIVKLLERDEHRGKLYILEKLFEPLILCSKPINSSFCGTVISEDALDRCIGNINKLFTTESNQSTLSVVYLLKISKILFKLYMVIAGTPCRLSVVVEDLLIRFLHALSDAHCISNVHLAFIFDEPIPDILEINGQLHFELGPTGGVQAVVRKKTSDVPTGGGVHFVAKYERSCELFKDLLDNDELYKKKVLYDLFNVLIAKLFSSWDSTDSDEWDLKPDLLTTEEILFHLLAKKEKKLMTIKLLADLSEHDVVKVCIAENPEPILTFLEVVLGKMASALEILTDFDEDEDDLMEVIIPLSIIEIASLQLKIGSSRWQIFEPLLPSILKIKEHHPAEEVQNLFSKLYERIATRGAANRERIKDINDININLGKGMQFFKGKTVTVKEVPKEQKALIKEVKSTPTASAENKTCEKEAEKCLESPLEKAIEMICTEDVPLKGHGILQLEKLIRKKDPAVLERKDQLFELLKQQLKDPDSYVYLSAVSALETLCSVDLERAVTCLCEEYMAGRKECSDYQLKVGEVLVRVTKCTVNIGILNRERMVNTFLFGTRSPDEFLRASSLSNLGEVLENIGYACGPILHEVFICVESIAGTDKSDMVRRAAVLLAHLLIKGYSGSALMGLEPVLRDLYRTLRKIEATDKDDVVRIHAQLALDEISSEVKASLFEAKRLEKKISILEISE